MFFSSAKFNDFVNENPNFYTFFYKCFTFYFVLLLVDLNDTLKISINKQIFFVSVLFIFRGEMKKKKIAGNLVGALIEKVRDRPGMHPSPQMIQNGTLFC
jgi:hypothetical protein